MAGTIAADTLTHSTAGSLTTDYVVNGSVKAWANTNQTSTQSNRDSFNVASITDGGLGVTTLAFTNSMNNGNYSSVAERGTTNTTAYEISLPYNTANTSSQYSWNGFSVTYGAVADVTVVSTAIFGDLA